MDREISLEASIFITLFLVGPLCIAQDMPAGYQSPLNASETMVFSGKQPVEDLIENGITFLNQENNTDAIRCFDAAINISSNSAEAWYYKGKALGRIDSRQWLEEIKCYDEATRIKPEFAEAWYDKGYIYELHGLDEKAIKCYDEAINANSSFAEAWYRKGYVFYRNEKYAETFNSCDSATRINPNYGEAWWLKGVALGQLGKETESEDAILKAKELGYQRYS